MERRAEGSSGGPFATEMLAAILLNAAAGMLYVWSLFIGPLEAAFGFDRAMLGWVSSVSLVSFTVAVALLPYLLARLGRVPVAILAFGLMAGGHILFSLAPSGVGLILGYGVGFGSGSGLGYGLALAVAAALPDRLRPMGIGLALGAFALGGIVLPVALGGWITTTEPAQAFLKIGLALLALGVLSTGILALGRRPQDARAAAVPGVGLDRPFFLLALAFFLLCFAGLAVVSQATALATDRGIATPGFATTLLTLGYLAGSLLGAPIAGRLPERAVVVLLGGLTALGAFALFSATAPVLLAGAALMGLAFGGGGAAMPMLLGQRYGADFIPSLYGRMIFAYGLSGLIAPALAGQLYVRAGAYGPVLSLCVLCGLLTMAVAFGLRGGPQTNERLD